MELVTASFKSCAREDGKLELKFPPFLIPHALPFLNYLTRRERSTASCTVNRDKCILFE